MTALVMGLDLSTTCTGLAVIDAETEQLVDLAAITPPSPKAPVEARCELIATQVGWYFLRHRPADVVAEFGGGRRFTDGLWQGRIHQAVWAEIGDYGTVAPSEAKRLAVGAGNASKEMVRVAAAMQWPRFEFGSDTADAAWVALWGARRLTAAMKECNE